MLLNRPAIKQNARRFIDTDRRWLILFIAGIIPTVLEYFRNGTTITYQIRNNFGDAVYRAAAINVWGDIATIIVILLMPIGYAVAGFYLRSLRGGDPHPASVYEETAANYGRYLGAGVLVKVFASLWGLLFVIPGIVKGIAYSMTPYIMHDNPNISPTDAITLSRKITRGHRWELFKVKISFFFWMILNSLTLFIASIYIVPYMDTTYAMCYEILRQNAIDTGIASPEDFGITAPPEWRV